MNPRFLTQIFSTLQSQNHFELCFWRWSPELQTSLDNPYFLSIFSLVLQIISNNSFITIIFFTGLNYPVKDQLLIWKSPYLDCSRLGQTKNRHISFDYQNAARLRYIKTSCFYASTQTPCWSVLDFWKINLKKSSLTNWIFSLFRTGFLLPV